MSDNFEILLESFIRAQNSAEKNFMRVGNKIARATVNDVIHSLSCNRLNQAVTRLSEAKGKPKAFASWLAKTIEILVGNHAGQVKEKAGMIYYMPADTKTLSYDKVTGKFYLLAGSKEILDGAEARRVELPENLLAVRIVPQAKKASFALKAAQKVFAKALVALAENDSLDTATACNAVAYFTDSALYSALSDKDKTALAALRRKAQG